MALFVSESETGIHHFLYCYQNQGLEDGNTEAVEVLEADLVVEVHEGLELLED